jgi:hypothetical protein
MKSFRNIFINWSKYFLKALLTTLWKVSGPFLTPNGITIQTKAPQSITKIILYLSSWAIEI